MGVTKREIGARHIQDDMLRTCVHNAKGPTFSVGEEALCCTRYSEALDRLAVWPPLASDTWTYIKQFFDIATSGLEDADHAMSTKTFDSAADLLYFQHAGSEPPGANFLKEIRMRGIVAVSMLLRKAPVLRTLRM